MRFEFGLSREVPADRTVGWGARFIFPDDLLWDRQDAVGFGTPEGERLKHWLNKEGALKKARNQARWMSRHFKITPDSDQTVTLFEDETGKIVANPNASYGYLYVAAFLKQEAA